ncbi:hypothetical protein BKA81DRAFT_225501 [Phyllosticta paracitricarpa]|uniref:Secreted protein n=1 Tax=Phyllosticta paracitricarpa TaxID=2016321 RepID=A0ABR1NAS3_9PEZI
MVSDFFFFFFFLRVPFLIDCRSVFRLSLKSVCFCEFFHERQAHTPSRTNLFNLGCPAVCASALVTFFRTRLGAWQDCIHDLDAFRRPLKYLLWLSLFPSQTNGHADSASCQQDAPRPRSTHQKTFQS